MRLVKKIYLLIVISVMLLLLCSCNTDKSVNAPNKSKNVSDNEASNQPDGIDTSEDDGNVVDKNNDENNQNDESNQKDGGNMKNNDGKTPLNAGITWEGDEITVYQPTGGGVWYPRLYELNNGTLLCGFDTNEDGGRALIKIVSSEDGGITWSEQGIRGTSFPEYDCANANFIELDNGEIWLSYRANVMEGDDYYSSIRVSVSKDGGKTWEFHSIVAEEKGAGGVYEPQFGWIGESIAVFYANDSLNVVRNGRQQNIEFKVWSGDNWGEKHIASDGTKTFSRDGMPVWCQMEDGSYAMVIESTSLAPSYEFIIQMKTSPDGYDWSDKLRNIYIPSKFKKKAGAPYIVKLSNGKLAVSFQTDEDATKTGDPYSVMKVMISTDENGTEFLPCSNPFATPDGYNSNWNGLLSYKDYLLAVTSTNYPRDRIVLRRGSIK